ncbi:MAG: DUF305 domain-containing protein [Sphingobacteriales bacterium JAD_PAG50586_3]|nr:MAG: DUF305 domain-containing protein [Sphingobacteriales bacterium JAD_PAG50586_3]
MKTHHETHSHQAASTNTMYLKLLVMSVLSFIAMYILMYSMVDKFSNVVPNVNQFYMAGLMAMPMVLIELVVMGAMYKNKKLNLGLLSITLVAGVLFFMGIRQQAFVGDKQFLKSMIPHHAAAILMVEEADLSDPDVKKLANDIITAQKAEIAQMEAKLKELE